MTPSRRHVVLVVDDEPQIVRAVAAILEARDFEVVSAMTAAAAMDRLLDRTPDLIVLDLTLPDLDGLELLARLRSFLATPILVLSARGDERDKVEALNGGADDYLTKPFSASEFLARVGALLRRATGTTAPPKLEVGDLVIDFVHRRVTKAGRDVVLIPTAC
jgi:two-component system KDP operon response regulator KdpE